MAKLRTPRAITKVESLRQHLGDAHHVSGEMDAYLCAHFTDRNILAWHDRLHEFAPLNHRHPVAGETFVIEV